MLDSSVRTRNRILVRGVNWLGDAVMTTPALRRLREYFPEAHITLLTHEKLSELWMRFPGVDEVLTFKTGESPWSIGGRLRGKSFDLALVLPNSPRSALEVWRAGIPRRVGYARPWRNWLLTQPVSVTHSDMKKRTLRQIKSLVETADKNGRDKTEPALAPKGSSILMHHTDVYLRLVSALGANSETLPPLLEIGDDELRAAEAKWLSVTTPRVWLGLSPSAAYGPAKRWPAENFASAIREVSNRIQGCRWIAFGGAEDASLGEQIASLAGSNVLNVAGKTTLRELMALLKLCRVLLTNDSGPMHLAAALGTPVVVPFGSTSPELTGPGLPGDARHILLRANVPCSPCFRRTCPIDLRCMTRISVSSVVEAVLKAASTER
jgi:heptosyltransferase II